jgi:ribosome-binding factor A
MENRRLQKIERLVQKELGELFLLQTKQMPGILISVSAVKVSPDLSLTKAYLSIFPSEKGEEIITAVRENVKSIRYDLGQRVKMQLRKIPELSFFIDDSLDYLDNIDNLLKKSKEN